MFVKFNATPQKDPKNVCGNNTSYYEDLLLALENEYESQLITKNEASWETTTIRHELKKLKESPCKFKVLYINCHGGKYSDTDESYAILAEGEYVTYNALKYLLSNRRPDEYYFIYITPCYGGGLLENYVHNNVDNENYSIVDEASELGTNYAILYSDCANSPAWACNTITSRGQAPSDLFNWWSKNTTYVEQAQHIKQLVSTCSSKNIKAVVDFLDTHYDFMRDELVDSNEYEWDSEAYSKSLSNAKNIIFATSRGNHDEKRQMILKYPIALLY